MLCGYFRRRPDFPPQISSFTRRVFSPRCQRVQQRNYFLFKQHGEFLPTTCLSRNAAVVSADFAAAIVLAGASGYLVLEDMHIKKSLVDMLELPLALRHGIIGRLEIQIPWSTLNKDPILVAVERVRNR